jgi:uncharacterized protein
VLIQIDKLKRRPRQINIDEQATSFPVLADLIEQEAVVFNTTISGTCEATWVNDYIEVVGQLALTVTSPCCRCLMPIISQLDVPVKLSYIGSDDEETPVVEELELQHEEISLIPFSGPEIDLRLDLGQEVIMALPQQSLCQETCRGLCPVCGCNLNMDSCDCDPPVFHAGLAALKSFKVK